MQQGSRAKSKGSALFVAIVVIFLITSAVFYNKHRSDMKNGAAVLPAVTSKIGTTATVGSLATSIVITNADTALAAANLLRSNAGGNTTSGAVSSAVTVNEMAAKNLEQLAADFSSGAAFTKVTAAAITKAGAAETRSATKGAASMDANSTAVSTGAGTSQPLTRPSVVSAIPPKAWPTGTEIIVSTNGQEVTEITQTSPKCLQSYAPKQLKTQYVISAGLQAEIKNGGICMLIATTQSIITSLNLPVNEWSKDGGNTIAPEFLDKVHKGAAGVDPIQKPGQNAADAQRMHENFQNADKKFVCQNLIDPSEVGTDKMCDYLKKAMAIAGHNCTLTVGNSGTRKGHAMDITDVKAGKIGNCEITTRATNTDQQGDNNANGVAAPAKANAEKWNIPAKGNAALVGGNPEPSDAFKSIVKNMNFDVTEVQCCFAQNKAPAPAANDVKPQ